MNNKLIKQLEQRSGNRCEIIKDGIRCNSTKYLQIHHILYRSRGGKDTLDNIIMACHLCHYDIHFTSRDKNKWIIKYQQSRYRGNNGINK